MRTAIALILLASLGCGQSSQTPDQIAAQEILAKINAKADTAAQTAKQQRVLDRLDTVEKLEAYLLFDKHLLEGVAEGKGSLEAADKVRQRVWDEILANDFHSLGL